MRGFFLVMMSVSFSAVAQDKLANCYSDAEANYIFMSENNISLYQAASLDRFEFEKNRDEIIRNRETQLRACADRENAQARAEVHVQSQKFIDHSEAWGRAPASLGAYEEVQSVQDDSAE